MIKPLEKQKEKDRKNLEGLAKLKNKTDIFMGQNWSEMQEPRGGHCGC